MKRFFVAALTMFVFAGCVSISSPVPFLRGKPNYSNISAESLNAVALQVERAIQEGNREPDIENRDGIVVNDDVVMQAIRTRAARAELVSDFLDTGYGREDNNGLLKVLGSREYRRQTTRRQRSRDALLVLNENRDRWAMFERIAKASEVRVSTATIQDAFYQARISVMKDGQKFQTAQGDTVVKGN